MNNISELLQGSKSAFIQSFEKLRLRTVPKQIFVKSGDTKKMDFNTPDNCFRWTLDIRVNSNSFIASFVDIQINGVNFTFRCSTNTVFTTALLFEGIPNIERADKLTISNTTPFDMTIQLNYDLLIKAGS